MPIARRPAPARDRRPAPPGRPACRRPSCRGPRSSPRTPPGRAPRGDEGVGFVVVAVSPRQLVVPVGEIGPHHAVLQPNVEDEFRMTLDERKLQIASAPSDDNAVDRHRAAKGVLRNDGPALVMLAECVVARTPSSPGPSEERIDPERFGGAIRAEPPASLLRVAQGPGFGRRREGSIGADMRGDNAVFVCAAGIVSEEQGQGHRPDSDRCGTRKACLPPDIGAEVSRL